MSQFYKLKINKIIKETANAVSVYFDIPADLASRFIFEAGQYLTLKANINGEEVRRAYSISSAEKDQTLRVSVKKVDGGKMSTYLVEVAKDGDTIEVMPPEGRFTLVNSETFVFVAGGSGITPIMSLVKKAKANNAQIHLLYANKSQAETMFKAELDELIDDNLNIKYFNSSEGNRLTEEQLKSHFNDLNAANAQIYICGPQGLIQSAESVAKEIVASDNQVHLEYFASPETNTSPNVDHVSAQMASGEIQLIIDGDTHSVKTEDYETILEAGERIGIDPPFSCQSGVCTTCRAKVIAGEVEMENNFGLGQDEIDEGYILTCISKPKGDGVVVSWDED